MKLNKQQRLEAETPEQKVTRLNRMSTLQQERLENETLEQRSVRFDQVILNRASCFHKPNGRPIPSLNDKCVKEKVNVLHKEMGINKVTDVLYLPREISWHKDGKQIIRVSKMLS